MKENKILPFQEFLRGTLVRNNGPVIAFPVEFPMASELLAGIIAWTICVGKKYRNSLWSQPDAHGAKMWTTIVHAPYVGVVRGVG